MSERKAGVYYVLLFLAITYLVMPFTKQIQIGFLKFMPLFFHKAEQQEQRITGIEKKIEKIEAKVAGIRTMTEKEVEDLFNGIFCPDGKR
jgi:hypothetical protein